MLFSTHSFDFPPPAADPEGFTICSLLIGGALDFFLLFVFVKTMRSDDIAKYGDETSALKVLVRARFVFSASSASAGPSSMAFASRSEDMKSN